MSGRAVKDSAATVRAAGGRVTGGRVMGGRGLGGRGLGGRGLGPGRARAGERPRGRLRRPAVAPVTGSARAGLTTRAAALGLVLCALVVSAALPLREYLAQRGRIHQAEQALTAQRLRVDALEHQRRLLDDPAYVASLARQRLHFVLPGETAYVVLGPDPAAVTPGRSVGGPSPAGDDAPWYSQLAGSLHAADSPAG